MFEGDGTVQSIDKYYSERTWSSTRQTETPVETNDDNLRKFIYILR